MANHHGMHGGGAAISAVKRLQMEIKALQAEPVEGFRVKLVSDENLFQWQVAIFGPPGTLYQGGYFKANMDFPKDYPYSPPSLRFTTKLWHPNVYENGDVCISILHPPTEDPQSGELPQERWNPTQSVNNILLSVISLLNEPNTYSPANVDASVMYRRWKESGAKDNDYERIVKKQVADTIEEAKKDRVVVPTTVEEYIIKAKPKPVERDEDLLMEFGSECGPYEDDDDCPCDDQDEEVEDDESPQASSSTGTPSKGTTSSSSGSFTAPSTSQQASGGAAASPSGSRQANTGAGATADDSGSEMS